MPINLSSVKYGAWNNGSSTLIMKKKRRVTYPIELFDDWGYNQGRRCRELFEWDSIT
jgi:hypothetical protein